MNDAPEKIDAATRAALDRLADVVTPPPVSWMPQTWGWAALGLLLLALATWAYVRWRRRREANRYRVEALAELDRLEALLADGATRAPALAAIPPLLKRVALAVWPRSRVAALSADAWVAFLRQHAGGAALTEVAARLFDDVEYRSPQAVQSIGTADAEAIVSAARNWIVSHRVSA